MTRPCEHIIWATGEQPASMPGRPPGSFARAGMARWWADGRRIARLSIFLGLLPYVWVGFELSQPPPRVQLYLITSLRERGVARPSGAGSWRTCRAVTGLPTPNTNGPLHRLSRALPGTHTCVRRAVFCAIQGLREDATLHCRRRRPSDVKSGQHGLGRIMRRKAGPAPCRGLLQVGLGGRSWQWNTLVSRPPQLVD
jgi:hypothetical protein